MTLESRMLSTQHVRFGGGPSEKDPHTGTSLAAYPTARRVRRAAQGNVPGAIPAPRPGPTEPDKAIVLCIDESGRAGARHHSK